MEVSGDANLGVWIIIVGGLASLSVAFGIGANDVANNFGPCIGAGLITFLYGSILGGIAELIGAAVFSDSVVTAIKDKIWVEDILISANSYAFANVCALISAAFWLILNSAYGIPISITHTAIGTLLGAGIATGKDLINWEQIGLIILSWFVSPISCMILSMITFLIVRKFILRQENSLERVAVFIWFMMFVTLTLFAIFFILKNPSTKHWAKDHISLAWGYSFAVSTGGTLLLTPPLIYFSFRLKNNDKMVFGNVHPLDIKYRLTGFPYFLKRTDLEQKYMNSVITEDSKILSDSRSSKSSTKISETSFSDISDDCGDHVINKIKTKWYSMPWFMDIVGTGLKDKNAADMDNKYERFNDRTEQFFGLIQVSAAIVCCVVHGANDTANAIAPFVAAYDVYLNGESDPDHNFTTPIWIPIVAGIAIGLGVIIAGHKVIQSVGVKLVKLTPSRASIATLSSVCILVIFTMLGFPLSTTHCILGSAIGIGLLEHHTDMKEKRGIKKHLNFDAVNGKLILRIFVAMILTLFATALISGLIFAFATFSPPLMDRAVL